MKRALGRVLSVQTATVTGSGVGEKRAWVTTGSVRATVVPVSRSDAELAGLRGERVTNTLLAPAGMIVDAVTTRFLDGSTVLRVSAVTPTPRGTVCVVEAMS